MKKEQKVRNVNCHQIYVHQQMILILGSLFTWTTINSALPCLHKFFSRYICVPEKRDSFGGFVPKKFGSSAQVYAVAAVDGFERSVYVPEEKNEELLVFSGKRVHYVYSLDNGNVRWKVLFCE